MTQDAELRQFKFNGENKQIEVKDGNGIVVGRYFYDGEGRRVKKQTFTGEVTIFVYSGGKLVAEYSTQQNPNPQTSYTTSDHLNSPRVITNGQGQVTSRRDFMPFGTDAAISGSRSQSIGYNGDTIRQKFTGYLKDEETNLEFAEARMYETRHGRFTAVDPLLTYKVIENPQVLNRYMYSKGNPLNNGDPTGAVPTDLINHSNGRRTVINDGKDQVIAVDGNTDLEMQEDFNNNRDEYNQNIAIYEKSSLNLHMTVAEFDNLAGVIYAEASNNAPWEEAAAIHGVLRNRASANGTAVSEEATVKRGVYGAGEEEKKKIFSSNVSQEKRSNVYKGLTLSIITGVDKSNGAYFWHGTDFGKLGDDANKQFYQTGFKFNSESHDIWRLRDRKSGKSNYDYTYESTQAFGQTTFMKLTEEWKKANGATRWDGRSK